MECLKASWLDIHLEAPWACWGPESISAMHTYMNSLCVNLFSIPKYPLEHQIREEAVRPCSGSPPRTAVGLLEWVWGHLPGGACCQQTPEDGRRVGRYDMGRVQVRMTWRQSGRSQGTEGQRRRWAPGTCV